MDDPYIPVEALLNDFVGPPKPVRVMVVALSRQALFSLATLQHLFLDTSDRDHRVLVLETTEERGLGIARVAGFEGFTPDTFPKKDISDLIALHLQTHMPLVETPFRFLGEDNNLGEQVSPYGPAPRTIGGHLRRYALGVKSKTRKKK